MERTDNEHRPQADEDFAQIFERCKNLHNSLADSLEKKLKQSSLTPSKIRAYIKRPQNFSQRSWKFLETEKEKNSKKLKELLKKIGREPKEKPTQKKTHKKQKRKGTIVSRKKWLGMH